MLAYYVEWHMREAWRSLLFADEDLDAKSKARCGRAGEALARRDLAGMTAIPAWLNTELQTNPRLSIDESRTRRSDRAI
jgi:hypothetical protein